MKTPHCFTRRAEGLPGIERDEKDTIRTAFFNLASNLSERDPDPKRVKSWFSNKLPEVITRPQYGSHRKWICTALFEPSHAKTLGKLYAEIQAGMERAYQQGKEDGSHLLSQLAKGEVTPADFEERRAPRKRW